MRTLSEAHFSDALHVERSCMDLLPFLTSVLGIFFRSCIDMARVKISFTMAKDKAEPFLLSRCMSESDLASSKRHILSPNKSSRVTVSSVLLASSLVA